MYDSMREWKWGMRHGLPIGLGYFAVSFAFGIQAAKAGLSLNEALLMSLTNVTSAGQFASLSLIAAQGSLAEMAILQLVINLRYFLMSCALSQKISENTGWIHRFLMAHGVTDEIFALGVIHPGNLPPAYHYGMMAIAIPGWCLGTMTGVIMGDILPGLLIQALGIAIYGMFIAIIIPPAKKEKVLMGVVLTAMALGSLFHYCPCLAGVSKGMQVILITLLVAGGAALAFPVKEESL